MGLVFDDEDTTTAGIPNPNGSIRDSCFIDNNVNNTILIYEEVAKVTLINTFAMSSSSGITKREDVICLDIALATVTTQGRSLEEFSCVDFDAETCALFPDEEVDPVDLVTEDAQTPIDSSGYRADLSQVAAAFVVASGIFWPKFVKERPKRNEKLSHDLMLYLGCRKDHRS
jgi:hypothetical protein